MNANGCWLFHWLRNLENQLKDEKSFTNSNNCTILVLLVKFCEPSHDVAFIRERNCPALQHYKVTLFVQFSKILGISSSIILLFIVRSCQMLRLSIKLCSKYFLFKRIFHASQAFLLTCNISNVNS